MKSETPLVQRDSCSIRRSVRNGAAVYVKWYVAEGADRPGEIVTARTAQEADVLLRLSQLGSWHPRVRVPELLEADPATGMLVLREVSGSPLEQWLTSRTARQERRSIDRAMWLAGRWLRDFQQLPEDAFPQRITTLEPQDLAEYCSRRIELIQGSEPQQLGSAFAGQIMKYVAHQCSRLTTADQRLVWTHGDFAPFNVLWDGTRLTVLDFAMCRPSWQALDASYFIHRLRMLAIYNPRLKRPVARWQRAFLDGYGQSQWLQSAAGQLLEARHWLCRWLGMLRAPRGSAWRRWHRRWVLHHVRRELKQLTRPEKTV